MFHREISDEYSNDGAEIQSLLGQDKDPHKLKIFPWRKAIYTGTRAVLVALKSLKIPTEDLSPIERYDEFAVSWERN